MPFARTFTLKVHCPLISDALLIIIKASVYRTIDSHRATYVVLVTKIDRADCLASDALREMIGNAFGVLFENVQYSEFTELKN